MKHETAIVSLLDYNEGTPIAKVSYANLTKLIALPLDINKLNKEIKYWENSFNCDVKRAINSFWACKGWGFDSKEDELACQFVYERHIDESKN